MSENGDTIEVALRFYNAGNYGSAERLCREVLGQCADDSDALHLMGHIAYQLGRYRVASRYVKKAILSNPNHPQLYNTLGMTFQAQGNIDAANEAYRHAVSLDDSCVDQQKAKRCQARLQQGDMKVGIVWAGPPNHEKDDQCSCSLKCFLPLTQIKGVQLYSLQKGKAVQQLQEFDKFGLVENLAGELGDFSDTAAAIDALDLVITVDTVVANLAGAMNKPIWLVQPYSPDRRSMQDREDTPRYPSMQLFRQNVPGDWKEVFSRVSHQLQLLTS